MPCFSGLLERKMYNILHEFEIKIGILHEKQSGFEAAHSAEHIILELANSFSNSFEYVNFTLGIFIDFSKAFDMVDHTILLNKLNQYSIQNKYSDWFKCYLNNCKQLISYVDYVPMLNIPYIPMLYTMLYTQNF